MKRNQIKLYDKDFNFVKRVDQPEKRFEGIQAYNDQGLYIKNQFNKAGKLLRTYSNNKLVEV